MQHRVPDPTGWQRDKAFLPRGIDGLLFRVQSTTADLDLIQLWQSGSQAQDTLRSLAAGRDHNCAVAAIDGRVKCWGAGSSGQLLHGSSDNMGDEPDEMGSFLPFVDLNETEALQVACAIKHSCALLRGGNVTCWGGADATHIGFAKTFAVQIIAGSEHGCALVHTGQTVCWPHSVVETDGDDGDDGDGALDGYGYDPRPFRVNISSDVTQLAGCSTSVEICALTRAGLVECLFLPFPVRSSLPDAHRLEFGIRATQVVVGYDLNCVLLVDGAVTCWKPTTMNNPYLYAIELPAAAFAVGIVAGSAHACARLQDESLTCWGRGSEGQLGVGSNNNVELEEATRVGTLVAVDVGPYRVRQVSAGGSHTCVLLSDDSVRCWGKAEFGQLGTGDKATVGLSPGEMGASLVPAEIFPFPSPGAELEELRLGGEGGQLLEVSYGGAWGVICDDGWDVSAAKVACKQLGLSGGVPVSVLHNTEREVFMQRIQCTGSELSLRECVFRGWKIHSCSSRVGAGKGREGRFSMVFP